jgi:hypothetical protein
MASCDIVFWVAYENGGTRYEQLSQKLFSLGVRNKVFAESYTASLFQGHLRIDFRAPFKRSLMIAKYLLSCYKPIVICVEDDMSPKYLHNYLRQNKVILVNLAHSPTGCTVQFNSLFYDYYFCFGSLSLARIAKRLSVGHSSSQCKVIPAGSPFWQRSTISVKKNSPHFQVGIVGSYFHSSFRKSDWSDFEKLYLKYCEIAVMNPSWSFLYKPHIVGKESKLASNLLTLNNVSLFSGSMISLSLSCDIVIMPPSASSVECAATNTPFLILEWSNNQFWTRNSRSYLQDTRYFDRLNVDENVNLAVTQRLRDLRLYQKLEAYYNMHIAKDDSIDFIAESLKAIVSEHS